MFIKGIVDEGEELDGLGEDEEVVDQPVDVAVFHYTHEEFVDSFATLSYLLL